MGAVYAAVGMGRHCILPIGGRIQDSDFTPGAHLLDNASFGDLAHHSSRAVRLRIALGVSFMDSSLILCIIGNSGGTGSRSGSECFPGSKYLGLLKPSI